MRKMFNKLNVILFVCIIIFCVDVTDVYSIQLEGDGASSRWLFERPIAHRGLHNNVYPENSIAAFNNAIKNNYPIELDLSLTKDNKVVVLHDQCLKRLTGDSRVIEDVLYNEIKNLKLLNSSESIPLFQDVLNIIDGKVPILIEIKSCNRVMQLISETNKLLENYKGEYAIQSFDPVVIEWYAKNAPEVTKGILLKSIKDEIGLKTYNSIILNSYDKPDFISIKLIEAEDQKVKDLRRRGFPILTWTIRNNDEALRVKKYSDNYIFEGILAR